MMNRRSFLGALAAVIAAPRILARILAAPAAAPAEPMVGFLDFATSTSLHGLTPSAAPAWAAGGPVEGISYSLNKVYRRIQPRLHLGFDGLSHEWDYFDVPREAWRLTPAQRRSGFGAWERRVLG